MDYYTQELFIPQVNEQDTIIDKVERWQAHKEGILHRGFTVGILYKGMMLCQHRKHPVFDGFVDLTASSHQLYKADGTLTSPTDAVVTCLEREWNITEDDLAYEPKLAGKVTYNSKHEEYIEHEVCHLYISEINNIPSFNPEYAYGFSLIPVEQLRDPELNPLLRGLAPWVMEMVMKNMFEKLG